MVIRVGPKPPGLECLQEEEVRTRHTQRNDPVRTREETPCLHAQEGGLRRPRPAHTWVWDSSSRAGDGERLLFKPACLWDLFQPSWQTNPLTLDENMRALPGCGDKWAWYPGTRRGARVRWAGWWERRPGGVRSHGRYGQGGTGPDFPVSAPERPRGRPGQQRAQVNIRVLQPTRQLRGDGRVPGKTQTTKTNSKRNGKSK